MEILAALAVGGGAWLRFHADRKLAPWWKRRLQNAPAWMRRTGPGLSILTINIIGSFIAGLLWGSGAFNHPAAPIITTGLLGGWTTFSSAMTDAIGALARHQQTQMAAAVGAAAAGTDRAEQPVADRAEQPAARIVAFLTLALGGFALCVLAAAAGITLTN
ncbi:MAG: CrcB family protein [Actinomycetaceae bacterium]|nr:CrcB family protein [Actinomycetaceae bacterium]